MSGAFILAGGSWIFLLFVIFFFFAIVHGFYTRKGSAINQRPYGFPDGDAPGARIPSSIGRDVERRDYQRGTR